MTDINLGELAEAEFRRLCLHRGGNLTVHKSGQDRKGWDFLVEFPWGRDQDVPVDLLPPPLQCSVQVKGTDGNRRRESISLANMHHLVKAQLPVFFCFIEFDGQNEPQAIYLVHVWEKIIERTLRRIRKNDAKSEPKRLNKATLDISYKDSHKLDQLTGQCLQQKIESCVPDGLEKYIQAKNRLLDTLGFKDGTHKINFAIKQKNFESLIDATLQYSENNIPVENLQVQHTRFGVCSHTKGGGAGFISFPEPPASISISLEPIPVELIFKDQPCSIGIGFPAEMFISPLHELIPDDYKKVRITSVFGDLFLKANGRIEAALHLPLHERVSLSTLNNLLNLLEMIENQPNLVQLVLKRETKISTCCDIGDCLATMFDNDVRGYFDLKGLAQNLESLAEICRRQSHLTEQLLLSFIELSSLRSSGDFLLIDRVIGKGYETFALFSVGIEKSEKNSRIGFICSARALVGNKLIAGSFGIIGSINSDDNGHFLRSENILIDNFFAVDAKQTISKECIYQSSQNLKLAMIDQDLDYIFIQEVA